MEHQCRFNMGGRACEGYPNSDCKCSHAVNALYNEDIPQMVTDRFFRLQKSIDRLQALVDKAKLLRDEDFSYEYHIKKHDKVCGTTCCYAGWHPLWFPEAGLAWRRVSRGTLNRSMVNCTETKIYIELRTKNSPVEVIPYEELYNTEIKHRRLWQPTTIEEALMKFYDLPGEVIDHIFYGRAWVWQKQNIYLGQAIHASRVITNQEGIDRIENVIKTMKEMPEVLLDHYNS